MNITFISAGAGSGKTYKLTEIIAQAVESGARPERIIATTFTNKASDEIRERVTKTFFEKGNLVMVQEAPAITIGTVNSVCGQLLGKFAFEAGLSPHLRVIEVEESKSLLRRVMERSVSPADRETFFEIERRFGYERDERDSWQRTALDIVGAVRSNGIHVSALEAMAERNAADVLSIFGPALVDPEPDLKAALERAIPEMEENQREKAVKKSAAYLELCRDFLTNVTKGRCRWKDWIELARGGYGKNCEEAGCVVEEMAARYMSHPRFHDDISTYLRLCFRAAADSLDAFRTAKREAGLIDFVDQESLLNDVLDNPEVQGRLSEELGLLLVDEFQDTSPIQLSVFIKLARLAERTVWVGDVKQAIYGFRGSDARLMAAVLESLPSLGGHIEFLDKSWRSRPALVELSNALFVPAFANELKPAHVKLTAQRTEYTDKAAFAHWLLPGNQGEQVASMAAGILALEASKFPAVDKESGKKRPILWKDIAVLVRQNATAESVRSSLQDAGIPCEGGSSGLLSLPVKALLLACLRRLNDRSDSLASAEILALSAGLSPEDWLEERIDYVARAGTDQGLWRCSGNEASPLLRSIETLRPLVLLLSPLELSQCLVTRCHLDRIVAGWSAEPTEAGQRIADLDALLELIASYQDEGVSSGASISLSRLILWLQEAGSEDDMVDHRGHEGVQVLTYHSAKGLEWPVCICYETTKPRKDRPWGLSVSKAREFSIKEPLAGRWIRFWPWPFGSLRKVDDIDLEGNEGVVELERETDQEARRLLYVGLTRARDLLVQAVPEKTQEGGLLECLGTEACTLLKPASPGTTRLTVAPGVSIPYTCQVLKAEAQAAPSNQKEQESSWFRPGAARPGALPAVLTPSEAPTAAAAGGTGAVSWKAEDYCNSQILISGGDPKDLGSIYHALVAWACSNPDVLENARAVADLLSRQASPLAFDAEALRASLKAFFAWIASTWPGSEVCAEHPVSATLDNGQRVVGRIDLLIRTTDGLVVMDHKLASGRGGKMEEIVATWAPQLALYATAITRVTGKPPVGTWLNLPLEGSAVRVIGAV